MIKIIIYLFSYVLLIHGLAFAQPENKPFFVDEELTYEVKYSIFKLGLIRIVTLGTLTEDGKVFYETKSFIDSYDGLPFVDLHSIYYSKFFEDVHARTFIGLDKQKENWVFAKYDFDYKNNQILIQKGLQEGWKIEQNLSMKIDTFVQDGLSLFFFARKNSGMNKTVDVPTVMNETNTLTTINFLDESVGVKIDAVDYKVDCYRLNGLARFKGILGLTGEFEGYFSKDEACIPIKAKMNVILGSVTIELKSWKRYGWQPPKKN